MLVSVSIRTPNKECSGADDMPPSSNQTQTQDQNSPEGRRLLTIVRRLG